MLSYLRVDVGVGMFLSDNVVIFLVVVNFWELGEVGFLRNLRVLKMRRKLGIFVVNELWVFIKCICN